MKAKKLGDNMMQFEHWLNRRKHPDELELTLNKIVFDRDLSEVTLKKTCELLNDRGYVYEYVKLSNLFRKIQSPYTTQKAIDPKKASMYTRYAGDLLNTIFYTHPHPASSPDFVEPEDDYQNPYTPEPPDED
jgi:hypothetical protein